MLCSICTRVVCVSIHFLHPSSVLITTYVTGLFSCCFTKEESKISCIAPNCSFMSLSHNFSRRVAAIYTPRARLRQMRPRASAIASALVHPFRDNATGTCAHARLPRTHAARAGTESLVLPGEYMLQVCARTHGTCHISMPRRSITTAYAPASTSGL